MIILANLYSTMHIIIRTVLAAASSLVALVPSASAEQFQLARDGEILNDSKTACIDIKVAKGKEGRVRVLVDTTEHERSKVTMKWDGRTVCGGSSGCTHDAKLSTSGVHKITITTSTPPYTIWRFLADWGGDASGIEEVNEVACKQ